VVNPTQKTPYHAGQEAGVGWVLLSHLQSLLKQWQLMGQHGAEV